MFEPSLRVDIKYHSYDCLNILSMHLEIWLIMWLMMWEFLLIVNAPAGGLCILLMIQLCSAYIDSIGFNLGSDMIPPLLFLTYRSVFFSLKTVFIVLSLPPLTTTVWTFCVCNHCYFGGQFLYQCCCPKILRTFI